MKNQEKQTEHNLGYLLQLCDMASRQIRKEVCGLATGKRYLYLSRPDSLLRGVSSKLPLHTNKVFRVAALCINKKPEFKAIQKIAVNLTHIQLGVHEQLDLFAREQAKDRRIMEAVDRINTRHSEQKV